MVLYFQRGYDQLNVNELHTSVNTVVSSPSSTITLTNTTTYLVLKLTSSSNQTVNLPSVSGLNGRMFIFYKTQSTGTVTIQANGTDKIDGASSQTITSQYGTYTIISDGNADWLIV